MSKQDMLIEYNIQDIVEYISMTTELTMTRQCVCSMNLRSLKS